jgi:hypothetical protein
VTPGPIPVSHALRDALTANGSAQEQGGTAE